jgi:hypothetical protein
MSCIVGASIADFLYGGMEELMELAFEKKASKISWIAR